MATEVLLMADVPNLGKAGDVVKVADGYARNYLQPQDLAAPVTQASLRRLDKLRKEREELSRIQKAEASAKAGKLKGLVLTITAKTTDGQRLYGSVTTADLAAQIEAQGVSVDRSQIVLAESIKEIGTYTIDIKLHAEVTATITVSVVEG
ncbi:MAG: 50S ribosomal protein L9 [Lentisphaerae bacterium]|nr:50S ribosomal protein L9 [Lentisphaerota bacterium]